MEFDAKDHFEALFNSTYLRWFHLSDKPALIEIAGVEKDVELTMTGGVKKKAPVLTFKMISGAINEVRPLVLNKTNCNAIAAIHGPKPSLWVGKQVVLYPSVTKMFNSETKKMSEVGCIRVREKKGA